MGLEISYTERPANRGFSFCNCRVYAGDAAEQSFTEPALPGIPDKFLEAWVQATCQ